MNIDLRSDTVTRPTPGMLEAMMSAETGDDVFGEDPTVNRLEARIAGLFGHEAGLFCASGTMANQVALKAQTAPMDEIIVHELSHIYYYETAGYAFHSGVSVKLVSGNRGRMEAADVEARIQPDYDWLPRTALVALENTSNKGGGTCYSLAAMKAISQLCLDRKLRRHLDGARLFNALEVMDYFPSDLGPLFDTITVCFSKGLGAPVGSILTGDRETIGKARRIRKVFGGGMRQAGILAAACLYALDHHLPALAIDRVHAQRIGRVLTKQPWVKALHPIATNIVLFDLADTLTTDRTLVGLEECGIRAIRFGPTTIRMVTHLDVSPKDIAYVEEKIGELRP